VDYRIQRKFGLINSGKGEAGGVEGAAGPSAINLLKLVKSLTDDNSGGKKKRL